MLALSCRQTVSGELADIFLVLVPAWQDIAENLGTGEDGRGQNCQSSSKPCPAQACLPLPHQRGQSTPLTYHLSLITFVEEIPCMIPGIDREHHTSHNFS